jgi:protease-4
MAMEEEKARKSGTKKALFVAFLLGIGAAYVAFAFAFGIPEIGVVKIEGAVLEKDTSDKIVSMLRYAGKNKKIRGVVLEINSPGGEVTVTEEIYLEVLALRRKKPVVASINQIGASGAYYISSASDYIVSAPSSVVGSIGVRAMLPSKEELNENTITSGPFKDTGSSREQHIRNIESIKQNFLSAVFAQRGDKIKVSRERLAQAEVFMGVKAKEIGLVDKIGSNFDAYEEAARFSGVKRYKILDINNELNITFSALPVFIVDESFINKTNTVPVYYYLYAEGDAIG